MSYQPRQGDIDIMDFQPQTGHEQRGRRPAMVVSNASFHHYTSMAIVCPMSGSVPRTECKARKLGETQVRNAGYSFMYN